jgi:hypothetical protein
MGVLAMNKLTKTMAATVAVATFVMSGQTGVFAKDKFGSLPKEKQQQIIDAMYKVSVPDLMTMNGKYSFSMTNQNFGKKNVQDMPSSITSSGDLIMKYAKDKDTYEMGLKNCVATLGKNDVSVKLDGALRLENLAKFPNTKIYAKFDKFNVGGANLSKYDKDGQIASLAPMVQLIAGKWLYADLGKIATTNKDFKTAIQDKDFQKYMQTCKELMNNPQAAYKMLGISEDQMKAITLAGMKNVDYTANTDGSITLSTKLDAKAIKSLLGDKAVTDAIIKNLTASTIKLGLDAKASAEYKKGINDAMKGLNFTSLSYSQTIKNGAIAASNVNYKFNVKEQDPDTYTTVKKKVGKKTVTQKVKKAGGYMVSTVSMNFSSTFDYTKADLETISNPVDLMSLTGGLTNLK